MKPTKLAALTAVLLSSTALSAQAEEELHLIMCGSEIRDQDHKVIQDFDAAHDEVTIKLEIVPWGTCQDKSLTLAAAGNPPSVAYMGSRALRQLSQAGLIEPTQVSEDMHYQPGVLNTVKVGDQYWGYPRAFSTKALYLNCDVIESAGAACEAPETWDDMLALAQTVVDNTDAAGVGLAGKDFNNTMHQFLNYLYSNGGAVIDPDTGENLLDTQQTRETLEFYGKLAKVAQEGPTAWERDGLRDLFNDNKIAMYVSGPWGAGQHLDKTRQKIVPVPHGPSGESSSILITDSIVVFKGSGHEELAHQFAQAFTSGQTQYELDSGWGLTPIFDYEALGWDDVYYKDGMWPVFTASIENGGPEPVVTDFKSLQSVFTNMVQGILLGDGTVEELVEIAVEELDEVR